ncbi:MAG: hypothetical protein OXT06_16005 [Rhodospirillaceae bacterium]|nr:hypothetical protein [Rhodospirillaceae bacterium]MDD9915870.1 hypothetical protein [Rhodospirillaceae bacterium]MDD9930145.1 hypothetical protein [Rhodospirillaceae bacterium]
MPNLSTHEADLRAIASAFKEQKEAGAVDHTAFIAAIAAYRMRHPDIDHNEAALVVFQLVDDLIHGQMVLH